MGCLVGEAKKKKKKVAVVVVVEWSEYERKSEAKHGLMLCCWSRTRRWKRRVCEGEDDKDSGE